MLFPHYDLKLPNIPKSEEQLSNLGNGTIQGVRECTIGHGGRLRSPRAILVWLHYTLTEVDILTGMCQTFLLLHMHLNYHIIQIIGVFGTHTNTVR